MNCIHRVCELELEAKVIWRFPKISQFMEKAPTRAFSWLKVPTSALTFKQDTIKTLC